MSRGGAVPPGASQRRGELWQECPPILSAHRPPPITWTNGRVLSGLRLRRRVVDLAGRFGIDSAGAIDRATLERFAADRAAVAAAEAGGAQAARSPRLLSAFARRTRLASHAETPGGWKARVYRVAVDHFDSAGQPMALRGWHPGARYPFGPFAARQGRYNIGFV